MAALLLLLLQSSYRYRCSHETCSAAFPSASKLERHMKSHDKGHHCSALFHAKSIPFTPILLFTLYKSLHCTASSSFPILLLLSSHFLLPAFAQFTNALLLNAHNHSHPGVHYRSTNLTSINQV